MLDAGLPVRAFFTTRAGGRSAPPYDSLNLALHVGDDADAVEANRAALRRLLGAPVAYMSQVHSATAVEVADADGRPEADALVTRAPGLAVAVLVADCVPVLLHDASSGAVAAVHAGRAGLVRGVVAAALDRMEAVGASLDSTAAVVGPAICGDCYEVPADMQRDVAAAHPATRSTTSWGTPGLDLRAGVAAALEAGGVGDVRHVGACTHERPDLFSHRRDGATGRSCGVILCGPA